MPRVGYRLSVPPPPQASLPDPATGSRNGCTAVRRIMSGDAGAGVLSPTAWSRTSSRRSAASGARCSVIARNSSFVVQGPRRRRAAGGRASSVCATCSKAVCGVAGDQASRSAAQLIDADGRQWRHHVGRASTTAPPPTICSTFQDRITESHRFHRRAAASRIGRDSTDRPARAARGQHLPPTTSTSSAIPKLYIADDAATDNVIAAYALLSPGHRAAIRSYASALTLAARGTLSNQHRYAMGWPTLVPNNFGRAASS